MFIVNHRNERSSADAMVALALAGGLVAFYTEDRDRYNRMRALVETHLSTVERELPETRIYFANNRYVVDNRGRKGYVLLVTNPEPLLGVQLTEAYIDELSTSNDKMMELLRSREHEEVRGGTVERFDKFR